MEGNYMVLKKKFPHFVTIFITAVGLFFISSSLIEGALLDPQPPGSYFLIIISGIFIGTGILSLILLKRGKLKKAGKSHTEVRRESIEKLNDTSLLSQTALKDPNSKIRKAAKIRLEELK
jgi:hypothetical protein